MIIEININNAYRVNDHISVLKNIANECRMTNVERGVMIDTINHFMVVKEQLDLVSKLNSDSVGEA